MLTVLLSLQFPLPLNYYNCDLDKLLQLSLLLLLTLLLKVSAEQQLPARLLLMLVCLYMYMRMRMRSGKHQNLCHATCCCMCCLLLIQFHSDSFWFRNKVNHCVVNVLNNSSTWYTDYSYGLCGCDYLLLCLAHVWVWVFAVYSNFIVIWMTDGRDPKVYSLKLVDVSSWHHTQST